MKLSVRADRLVLMVLKGNAIGRILLLAGVAIPVLRTCHPGIYPRRRYDADHPGGLRGRGKGIGVEPDEPIPGRPLREEEVKGGTGTVKKTEKGLDREAGGILKKRR